MQIPDFLDGNEPNRITEKLSRQLVRITDRILDLVHPVIILVGTASCWEELQLVP